MHQHDLLHGGRPLPECQQSVHRDLERVDVDGRADARHRHAGFANYLNGVSCVSATSCHAVGWAYSTGSSEIPLVESWNGTTWAVDSVPTYTSDVKLYGISCVGASCQAVGVLGGTGQLALGLMATAGSPKALRLDQGRESSAVSLVSRPRFAWRSGFRIPNP